ncbi:hypothetical protein C5O25_10440 [Paramuribaculum intestinale]|uniref:Uncharacterized protein n=2 Tax=Paramuribaculum intestinale TaxID=2094151 RepID=A0A2V1IVH6_9BACT|nr:MULTISPECIES: hypothetical protein [Muribaculaceae]MBJ2185823.1 hypothetical protein [Muribaculaceae bacterium]ROS93221.1 hypothetical protein EEL36_05730 [Muribaculaceae bacterium Isolate-043 (Harlan)]MCX4329221.1 hypothetical protein [Paramuribaculum intestinale]PWB05748.1 hypothetical protein C5O24_11150 [Paramuribaculum intestinale]PWB06424.1 hypothetical protein C5O25_10440 [Paramuribaculum intestinale]
MKKREYITIAPDKLEAVLRVYTDGGKKSKPSLRLIRATLNYEKPLGMSKNAIKLRQIILCGGGKITYDGVTSEEVFFDSDGSWVQRYSNGAQITISKATGKAVLTRNGKVKVEIERAKHSEIMALQKAAREL